MHTNKAGKKHWLLTAAIFLAFTCFIGGCGGSGSGGAIAPSSSVSGVGSLSDPLVGATLKVCTMGGTLLYQQANATDTNGLFTVSVAGLPSQFYIELTGGTAAGAPFVGYLKRVVNDYSPDAFYEANEVTTLVAGYMQKNPGKTYAEAEQAVKTYLSIPDSASLDDVSQALAYTGIYFSDKSFWDELDKAGGKENFTSFVDTLIGEIGSGTKKDFSEAGVPEDLLPFFPSDQFEFPDVALTGMTTRSSQATASTSDEVSAARKPQAVPAIIGAIQAVMEIVQGIDDDIEKEQNIETLNRIDKNVETILNEVGEIKRRLTKMEGWVTDADWKKIHHNMVLEEQNYIMPAYQAYKEFVNAQRDVVKGVGGASVLSQKKQDFINAMETKATGELTFDSFETMLNTMANDVVSGYGETPALPLYAKYVSNKIGTDPSANYIAVEDQFMRFIYDQLITLKLFVQYRKIKPDGKYADWTTYKQGVIGKAIKGNGTTADPRLGQQVKLFLQAVEDFFFLSRTTPASLLKWMRCDTLQSYYLDVKTKGTSKDPFNCREQDKPFTRSTYVANSILTALKAQGYCADSTYSYFGSGGTFMRFIQIAGQLAGVPSLQNRGINLTYSDSSEKFALDPVAFRTVPGKNPFYEWFPEAEKDKQNVVWEIATYWTKDLQAPGKGYLAFDLTDPSIAGMHPFTESGYWHKAYFTQKDGYPPRNLFLRYVQDKNSGVGYSTFSTWMVPVRDGRMSLQIDRGFIWAASDRYWRRAIYVNLEDPNCNIFGCRIRVQEYSTDGVTGAQPLRFYHLGVAQSAFAIAYFRDNWRYFILPFHFTVADHSGGVKTALLLEGVGNIGYDKIYWKREDYTPTGWLPAYTPVNMFSHCCDNQNYLYGSWTLSSLVCGNPASNGNIYKAVYSDQMEAQVAMGCVWPGWWVEYIEDAWH